MENLRGTVENLYKILDGKVTLTERELKGKENNLSPIDHFSNFKPNSQGQI